MIKRELTNLVEVVSLALFWLGGVSAAIVAVWPFGEATKTALLIAVPATMIAVVIYILLLITRKDREGLPIFLLFAFPFVCVVFSAPWWIFRALGLWPPTR